MMKKCNLAIDHRLLTLSFTGPERIIFLPKFYSRAASVMNRNQYFLDFQDCYMFSMEYVNKYSGEGDTIDSTDKDV